MMVPEAIFIVKFDTRLKNYQNFDVSLDWSIQYLSDKMLFVGLGSHFHSEIQHPASEKVLKFHLCAHNL